MAQTWMVAAAIATPKNNPRGDGTSGLLHPWAGCRLAGAAAELAGNAAEHTGQLRAEAIHHRDDRYRDAGRDQAVLNGGRAGIVIRRARLISEPNEWSAQ